MSEGETREPEASAEPSSGLLRKALAAPFVLIGLVALYYVGGAIYLHSIDDAPNFAVETSAPQGASRSVAATADLIDREINTNRWVANDPFFLPGWALDNMPNYQQGIIQALSRYAVELTDQIARRRGSSSADPDLEKAAGLLKYAGDIWVFDFSTSWAPTAPSEQQYRAAMTSLRAYNERLANGQAVFDRRADNLLGALDRFAADIGSLSAATFDWLEQNEGAIIDFLSDDLFYQNKGRIYAYYVIMRELGVDFQDVIAERGVDEIWGNLIVSLREAALIQPWVVANGDMDGLFRPNHLAAQGFLMLRARTQLKEATDILSK